MDFRDQVPGYREAVAKEQIIRDAAFLGLNESIGDFEAVPFTLRHYVMLRAIRSPFVVGGSVGPLDVIAFLSVVVSRRGRKFNRDCKRLNPRPLPALRLPFFMKLWRKRTEAGCRQVNELIPAIDAYISSAFMDCGGGSAGHESYYSDAAALSHRFGAAYGWTVEQTMNQPLKVLFQMLKAIKADADAASGKNPVLHNPSGRLVSDWLAELNQKTEAN